MINFKENYHFSRFQRGSNIFKGGGPNFFQRGGGVLLLISYINPFPGGGSLPPLDPHLTALTIRPRSACIAHFYCEISSDIIRARLLI